MIKRNVHQRLVEWQIIRPRLSSDSDIEALKRAILAQFLVS